MTEVAVFLGPTLGWDEAARCSTPSTSRRPLTVTLHAVRRGVRVIGLVDGVFERVPAVWHKEILFALSEGVHVYGAASMGALRAAELDTFGMRGVGASLPTPMPTGSWRTTTRWPWPTAVPTTASGLSRTRWSISAQRSRLPRWPAS